MPARFRRSTDRRARERVCQGVRWRKVLELTLIVRVVPAVRKGGSSDGRRVRAPEERRFLGSRYRMSVCGEIQGNRPISRQGAAAGAKPHRRENGHAARGEVGSRAGRRGSPSRLLIALGSCRDHRRSYQRQQPRHVRQREARSNYEDDQHLRTARVGSHCRNRFPAREPKALRARYVEPDLQHRCRGCSDRGRRWPVHAGARWLLVRRRLQSDSGSPSCGDGLSPEPSSSP